jgi:hypothetical protein
MPKEKLLYRTVPHNGDLVFATPERALLIARIHRAIEASKASDEPVGNDELLQAADAPQATRLSKNSNTDVIRIITPDLSIAPQWIRPGESSWAESDISPRVFRGPV